MELIDLNECNHNIDNIILEVHSEWEEEIYNNDVSKWKGWGTIHEETYELDTRTKQSISKAFIMYSQSCTEWIDDINNSNINRHSKLKEFHVEVIMKNSGQYSDSSDSDED